MDISSLDNKALIAKYIFQYPTEHLDEQEILEKELERRDLMKEAKQIFARVYDYFQEIWVQRENEK